MRNSFAAPMAGAPLTRTPSSREQAARRRIMVICAILALAVAGGVAGRLSTPRPDPARAVHTGPLSYLSE